LITNIDMSNLKCIIIDDDPLITDLMMHFSEKLSLIDYCVACNDPVAGLKLLVSGDFDLLFLDYNMPSLNGKDILELKQDNSKVVMITSDRDFAVESYKYQNIFDYLLKPLNYERFEESVQRFCARQLNTKQEGKSVDSDILMVKDGSKWIPVRMESIKYIQSDSNYCVITTTESNIMSLVNLKTLQEKLPAYFIRSHRSYIINTKFIEFIHSEEISIAGKMIPISGKYKSNVKDYINSIS